MSRPVILLVDDEQDLLQVMSTALGLSLPDYEIVGTTTADEATEIIEDLAAMGTPLALVLVDHVLGGETGLDLLDRIRVSYPEVPALVVTGQAPQDVEEQARQAGARVLWKPMRLKQLLDEVVDLLEVG